MYSPNKPRPKSGYQCKICGKEGGQPDSHWFQLCPFKGQQNEATTYIPPKKGYFCKYCLKPGGEKDSHWFQQCPYYKKNHHSRHHRASSNAPAGAALGGVAGMPQHYGGALYHPGMAMSTPGASMYDYHHHPAVAANGMILSLPAICTCSRRAWWRGWTNVLYETRKRCRDERRANKPAGKRGADDGDL